MSEDSEIIYLDHHATTPVLPEVREAMMPYLTEKFGNPSSTDHRYGQEASNAVDEARESIADLIGSRPEEVIFTSGSTESDNLAIVGLANRSSSDENHIITTAVEHKAVLEPMHALEDRGFDVTYLPVDETAQISLKDLEDAIRDDTFLISVMAANNEVGTIYPTAEIGKIAKEHGIYFHVDAAQAVGHIPVDVEEMGIDLMSFSAHKMYGPKGIGALYVRRRDPKVKLDPMLRGGGHERGMRSGTLNVPSVVGFGKAVDVARADLEEEAERERKLRDEFYKRLAGAWDQSMLNGPPLDGPRLPHNLHMSFPPLESQAIIRLVSSDLAISSGSACETDRVKKSHVLQAMGLSDQRAYSALRVGVGRSNTEECLGNAYDAIKAALSRLQKLRPVTG